MQNIYVFDSNSFITPYNTYYPFDFAPGFWRRLGDEIQKGSIVVLDKVYDELVKGDDDLSQWMKSRKAFQTVTKTDKYTLAQYAKILEYIQSSEFYKGSALLEWAKDSVADAWLIASAVVHKYTLVTFETPSGGLSVISKSAKAKIPDICDHFGVEYISLFQAMRELSIQL